MSRYYRCTDQSVYETMEAGIAAAFAMPNGQQDRWFPPWEQAPQDTFGRYLHALEEHYQALKQWIDQAITTGHLVEVTEFDYPRYGLDGEQINNGYAPPAAPWGSGQTVVAGDMRSFDGFNYRVLQGHTTQPGWEPPNVPALWAMVSELEPEPGIAEAPPWRQPTGGHDAYAAGAVVSHNGQTWASLVSVNVWEPGAYGWEVMEP